MRYFLLIFAFFAACNFSYSQDADSNPSVVKKGLSEAEFIKAKEGYLKMSYSDLYKKHKGVAYTIGSSLVKIENIDFYKTDEDFSKWIYENLALTKFKSAEEAIRLRKLSIELQGKLEEENVEVFELVNRATVEQLKEILKPDFIRPSLREE